MFRRELCVGYLSRGRMFFFCVVRNECSRNKNTLLQHCCSATCNKASNYPTASEFASFNRIENESRYFPLGKFAMQFGNDVD